MIINNSKKALAAKIRNSGFAWPDSGKWAIQDKDGEVFVCSGISVPVRRMGEVNWEFGEPYRSAGILSLGPNWFQCILSRDEYFHLYPAPDAISPMDFGVVDDFGRRYGSKPTIEQLAAEYRNRKDYAERKQQEAGAAKAEADVKLAELVAAGKAVGLAVSVAAPEPELVITDWRDLQVGDEVEYLEGTLSDYAGVCGVVDSIDRSRLCGDYRITVKFHNGSTRWCSEWRFIRRPAKGGANA